MKKRYQRMQNRSHFSVTYDILLIIQIRADLQENNFSFDSVGGPVKGHLVLGVVPSVRHSRFIALTLVLPMNLHNCYCHVYSIFAEYRLQKITVLHSFRNSTVLSFQIVFSKRMSGVQTLLPFHKIVFLLSEIMLPSTKQCFSSK